MTTASTDWEAVAKSAAKKHGLDPNIFARQIRQESGFNPTARSGAGAEGIAQIMPNTAKGWGVDPMDPAAALDAAARAMAKYVKSYGSYRNALIAYNAGPGAVGKPLPSETTNYIKTILGGVNAPGQTSLHPSAATSATGSAQGTTTTGGPFSDQQRAALVAVSQSNPGMEKLMALINQLPHQSTVAANTTGSSAPSSATPTHGGPGHNYLQLFNWAHNTFGLTQDDPNPRDPNNAQSIGGTHVDGSNHYKKLADDFGDAKNTHAELMKAAAWAKAHPQYFSELYYNPLGWGIKNGKVIKGLTAAGHDNHMHMAVYPTAKAA